MPARIQYKLDDLMRRLRQTRRRLSWVEVAEDTGISPQLLSKLRHRESVVTNIATLITLYRYFGCRSWDELFEVTYTDPDERRLDELFPDRQAWQPPAVREGEGEEG